VTRRRFVGLLGGLLLASHLLPLPALGQGQPIPHQGGASGTHPVIAKAFLSQVKRPEGYILQGTTIVSTYALQSFREIEFSGGEALLSYSPSQGWKVVTLGGGAMDASILVSYGVPKSIATQLIAGRNRR